MSFIPKMLFMDDDDGSGGGGAGTETSPVKPKLSDLIAEHELQDELNTMMAANRKKLTQQNQELVKQLEQIKQNSQLTQEERDGLQVRITQLEEQYMSKEELSKRESQKQQKEFEGKLNNTQQELEQWRNMYSSSTIERALQDAAIEGKALHPSQIVDLLRGRTQLVEVLENGQPTGKYQTLIKFNDVNEDGENVTLDLSPTDTIKRMKELTDKYGNLFEGTATGGVGGSRGADGSGPSPKLDDLVSDPVKYAEWRKNNPDLDISKLRR
jgi:hypothetical protein